MSSKPSVALVHDWLTNFAGSEQVLLALHEMFPDAPIYTSLYRPEEVPQFKDATVIPSYLQRIPGLKSRHQVAIPLMPQAFESFDVRGYDVVISVGNGLSKGVITHPGQIHVSYCNTPIRYIWNLGGDTRNEKRFDSWLRNKAMHSLRVWDVASASRPDQYLANSRTTQARITKIYRRDSTVVYPPVRTERFLVPFEQPEEYMLSVGRLVSYKRIDLIVEACVRLRQPLKVVGTGPEMESLTKLAAQAPWIEFLGSISNEDLPQLYAKAKAFLFAGEEDFGIVPVEAMCTGRPVIAYGRGGLTETVVAGKTGEFFQEQTVEALTEALASFKADVYDPKEIRARALEFDVEVFKGAITKIVQQLLERS